MGRHGVFLIPSRMSDLATPDAGGEVDGFARKLAEGAMASQRSLMQRQYDDDVDLLKRSTSRIESAFRSWLAKPKLSDRDPVPSIDDPTLLRYSIQEIDTFRTSVDLEAGPTGVLVHLTWDKDPQSAVGYVTGRPFVNDLAISQAAKDAVAACGYSDWPAQSLKAVFDVFSDSCYSNFKPEYYYEDAHLKAISFSGVCGDHKGHCCQLALWSSPSNDNH